MKNFTAAAIAAITFAVAGTAAAALSPSVYIGAGVNPNCATSTYANGVLHLAKTCTTSTNAAAQADITGANGQTFTTASFTLASPSQCNGGSPRFNVSTSTTTYFLGCNNVAPAINADGSATYTFNAATLAAAGQQVPTPIGAITGVQIVLDVQGAANLTRISFNGVDQVPAPVASGPRSKSDCKDGGWKTFTNPSFRNQGQCVSYVEHHLKKAKHKDEHREHKHGHDSHHEGHGK